MTYQVTSKDLKDCTHLKIVPVIVSFDSDRHIRPLYIRIDGESLRVYKATVVETFHHQITYQCEVEDNGFVKPVRLTYFANEALWAIPNIL